MTTEKTVETKEAIRKALEHIHSDITENYKAFPLELLTERPSKQVWSAADHLRHLIKSVRSVNQGLSVPKVALKMRFGTASHSSRGFDEMVALYKSKLAEGLKAGDYGPSLKVLPETEEYRTELLSKWQDVSVNLIQKMSKWDESDLDKFVLPHPAIGKLTIRELLAWTVLHDFHHLSNVQGRLGLTVSDLKKPDFWL